MTMTQAPDVSGDGHLALRAGAMGPWEETCVVLSQRTRITKCRTVERAHLTKKIK